MSARPAAPRAGGLTCGRQPSQARTRWSRAAVPGYAGGVNAPLRPTPTGLTSAEALTLLQAYGPNEPAPVRSQAWFVQLLLAFANPLVTILLLASVVSAVLGDRLDAIIVAAMVLLSGLLNFSHTYRSQRAASRLRDSVALQATVQRDGVWQDLPRTTLVPGDLIRLSAGDLVPADAELLESRDLHVAQAALTGEPMPAEKEAGRDGDGGRVHLGTSVVSGTALARITATGAKTQFGDIVARLSRRAPETEFDRGLARFSHLIAASVFFLVLAVILIGVVRHRDPLQSLLFAVALAVGLTPEFLPMIVAVTLSKGAIAMARRKVIVKHLSSIQNLGSLDILCTDKTGTLTTGVMEVARTLDVTGRDCPRVLQQAWLNSHFQSGIHSPLDAAVLRQPGLTDEWTKVDELPFDFERRRLSVVLRKPAGPAVMITKGSSESVLSCATHYEAEGETKPLDESVSCQFSETYRMLSEQGYYVVAVACKSCADQPAYTVADERDLTLLGFIALSDPPVEDVAETLATLRSDGVQIKIVTGDNPRVALHICEQVGLQDMRVVLGQDLEGLTPAALGAVAETTDIFARVNPAQKNLIILALKLRGHVVGFFGDGINDAPSLHAADVGISAPGATDVARDAADVLLQERDLKVLHAGIVEGRRAFGNVIKYLLMGTSSNFGNMVSMAGASLFLPFLPMLSTQILLNNFLYDLSQVTIPTDNVDESFVQKPQRWDIRLIRNFMLGIGPISSIFDFLTFWALLSVFHASEATFHTGWFVESLATQTLVLFIIRTTGNPFRSRPSLPLALTTTGVVAVACLLPYTGLAADLGFTPLPPQFAIFLTAVVVVYLTLVQFCKTLLLRWAGGPVAGPAVA